MAWTSWQWTVLSSILVLVASTYDSVLHWMMMGLALYAGVAAILKVYEERKDTPND